MHGLHKTVEPLQGYVVIHIVGDMDDIVMSLFDQMFCCRISTAEIIEQDFINLTVVRASFNQNTVDRFGGNATKELFVLAVAAVGDDAVCASLCKIIHIFHSGMNVVSPAAKQHIVAMLFAGVLETRNQVKEEVIAQIVHDNADGHGLLQDKCPGKTIGYIVVFFYDLQYFLPVFGTDAGFVVENSGYQSP